MPMMTVHNICQQAKVSALLLSSFGADLHIVGVIPHKIRNRRELCVYLKFLFCPTAELTFLEWLLMLTCFWFINRTLSHVRFPRWFLRCYIFFRTLLFIDSFSYLAFGQSRTKPKHEHSERKKIKSIVCNARAKIKQWRN